MKKAIVLAGSRGIGKGIADELESISSEVIRTSSNDLDTSDIVPDRWIIKEWDK